VHVRPFAARASLISILFLTRWRRRRAHRA